MERRVWWARGMEGGIKVDRYGGGVRRMEYGGGGEGKVMRERREGRGLGGEGYAAEGHGAEGYEGERY